MPQSVFGEPEAVLFGRRMPWSWLWGPDRLLSALIAVGYQHAKQQSEAIQIQPDEGCILGYSVAWAPPFETTIVDAALATASRLQHRGRTSGTTDIGQTSLGTHLEFYPLVYALHPLVDLQGLTPQVIAGRVASELPETFLWTPRKIP
jgi:hypothetical protein